MPVEILTTATPKEPPNQSLAQFANLFKAHKRVGSLLKETASGKLVKEWDALTAEKPEMVEIATAVSSFISVKDEDDLVIGLVVNQRDFIDTEDARKLCA